MAEKVEILKKEIIDIFPKLSSDSEFDITSPDTSKYNCIAWAYGCSDRWMQPYDASIEGLDSVYFWPDGVSSDDFNIKHLVDAFRTKDYEICDTWIHEEGYQKIALYVYPDSERWTHAAREIVGDKKNKGKWTSKLGKGNDISHGSPYTIEGDSYGIVYCIMKRKFD